MATALGRRLWLIVGAALVLTALLVFISGRGSTARVAVADVVRENLSSVVSTNGKVEPVAPQFVSRNVSDIRRSSVCGGGTAGEARAVDLRPG